MSIPITFCGIEGNTRVPDGNGIRWSFDLPNGYDSPDLEIEFGDVTGRSGVSLIRDEVGARLVAIDVTARADTDEAVDLAWRIIKGSLPPRGSSGDLVVYEETPKFITVRRASGPRVTRYPRVVKGLLQVAAIYQPFWTTVAERDPVPIAASASGSIINDGDEEAVIKVTTTGAGFVKLRRNDTNKIFETRVSVDSGTVFDGKDKSIKTAGGLDIFPMKTGSVWITIPRETTLSVSNLGTAPVNITSHDAYA